MVPSQNEEIQRILDFVSKQEADGLQVLFSSVDVVSKEKVVFLRRISPAFEQPQQVVVLAVDVSADLDRGRELQEDRLVGDDRLDFSYQKKDFLFGEVDKLAGFLLSNGEQLFDDLVDVAVGFHRD